VIINRNPSPNVIPFINATLAPMFSFFFIQIGFFSLCTTFMYMESCVFECEDFPKENRMQANKATDIG
ncbi:hypothetical protein ACGK9U_16090, partial [Mariniflexile sp. HNIBRBA6329]|uniref:hypothetical protein n=1 Tax=Mariniflexile sp. HNIBRBA6329 TaxID=3373088 RepID=UPI003746D7D8